MTRFDDYHRTVVGYHGTGLAAALRLINRVDQFKLSDKDYDWLGRGIYFWEYAPKQALEFAEIRQKQYMKKVKKSKEDVRRAQEPLAVVACTIRLGFCLDLTEPENVRYLSEVFASYKNSIESSGDTLPENNRKYRKLDRAVFEYAYKLVEESAPSSKVDTARGIYVPSDRTKRIWEGSWISQDTHIQICVRNPANLLGIWLHYPTRLEVNDVCQTLKNGASVID